MNISSSVSGTESMNSGCSFSSHARLSSSLPRSMSVCSLPVEGGGECPVPPPAAPCRPAGRAAPWSSSPAIPETLFSSRQRPRCMHDADVVAHVLQLAEVVRRYEHRHALLRHILHDKRPHLPPHHGVEAVHRLIEHEYLRPRRKRDPERRLLLHAARKAADGARIVKREDLAQLS